MTKKDTINWLLMAPLLLTLIGLCIYAMVLAATAMQPLGFVALALIVAFVIGAIRFLEI
jgi:hypothetical protein